MPSTMIYHAEEQYQSMHRAYEALQALANDIGKTVVIGDHAAGDATKLFFNECYHLKDWLKKDSRIKNPQDVEDFISKSSALSLAADLCNSMKHAGLDKSPRSGMTLNKINMAYSLNMPKNPEPGFIKASRNPSDGDTITLFQSNQTGHPIATAKVVLTIDGQKHDAPDVATQCVKSWDAFLTAQGLQFSKTS